MWQSGIAESNIPTLVIPYVKTAAEGIRLLGSLVSEYGSAESNGVVIADPNEAWYIEIYTGHQWLAIKLPEDKVAVIPNAAVIGCVDISDTENVIATPDFWEFAQANNFLVESDGQPHAAMTYGADRFDTLNIYGNQYRFWGARQFFAPSQTGDIDETAYYDAFFVPDEKITIADCMELMRYRYEDTEYDTNVNKQYSPHRCELHGSRASVLDTGGSAGCGMGRAGQPGIQRIPAAVRQPDLHARRVYERHAGQQPGRRLFLLSAACRTSAWKTVSGTARMSELTGRRWKPC